MKIIEKIDKHHYGIMLWKDEWLNAITKLSGSLAKDNEYQVHFWGAVWRKRFNDDSILDVCIPLVIYNYPQIVTPISIDFEMKDINEASDETAKLLPYINLLRKKLFFGEAPIAVSKMTLHRHP